MQGDHTVADDLTTRIKRLEESLARLQEADPDDVDPDEYARLLRELVELRNIDGEN